MEEAMTDQQRDNSQFIKAIKLELLRLYSEIEKIDRRMSLIKILLPKGKP